MGYKRFTQEKIDTVKKDTFTLAMQIPVDNQHEWHFLAQNGFGRMPKRGIISSIHWVAESNCTSSGPVTGMVFADGIQLQQSLVDLKDGISGTLKSAPLTNNTSHLTVSEGALIHGLVTNNNTTTFGHSLSCIVTYDVIV